MPLDLSPLRPAVELLHLHFGNWKAVERAIGFPHATMRRWAAGSVGAPQPGLLDLVILRLRAQGLDELAASWVAARSAVYPHLPPVGGAS
jgi:hypothetical protein